MDEALNPVPTCRIEQHAGADNIGVDEIQRRINAAIDVRFGGEIDDRVKLMLGHERVHLISVGDIGFEKLVTLAMFFDYAVKIGEITRVSEHVDVGHGRGLVMLQNIPNKIAPDEAAATGYQNAHRSAY